MQLISQHVKAIMEGCKERARAAGLRFDNETLEYIVTNRDLIELGPKVMIPNLYDFWVHDVEVLREKGRYELYPNNPYETVINTRPAISFYNDNNPDWLNVMIFYHVLAHIDFFQNNFFFRNTWDQDFNGQALADKRLLTRLRSERGRWVDYVLEFARAMDNLVGFGQVLSRLDRDERQHLPSRVDYYFDVFIQSEQNFKPHEYVRELERYNALRREHGDLAEEMFFADVLRTFPEFETLYAKSRESKPRRRLDPMEHIMEHSPFLKKEENAWMLLVLHVVRNTSLFFQPQIRTKILNEGWASYWHERLFLRDDRIRGHEVEFARVNAGVTALPRVGLNPYATGMRLFQHIEESADKGRYTMEFQNLADAKEREAHDRHTGRGQQAIFHVRENHSDFTFIRLFVDQEFVDRYKLFVVGKRQDPSRGVWQYYVQSRSAEAYRQMLQNALYHPPHIEVDPEKTTEGVLYLNHSFEGKPLVNEFIAGALMGMEYLWGGAVKLETTDLEAPPPQPHRDQPGPPPKEEEFRFRRVLYTMRDRKLSRSTL